MKTFTTYSFLDEILASTTEPIDKTKRDHQLTRMWQGLRAMELEAGPTREDWMVVSDAVNMMETLVTMSVLTDPNSLLADAEKAMNAAKARGTIRLDGEGIQAVRAVLEDYAQVLEAVPARTIIRAHRRTEQMLQKTQKRK